MLRLLFAVVLLSGCGDDGGPGDGGVGIDAGDGDAGLDAGTDAAPGADTGTDTGLPVDGGEDARVSMPCTAAGMCNPFDPESCGTTMACRPDLTPEGTGCGPLSAAVRMEGESCTAPDDCVQGTLCLDFGEGLSCQRMCPDGSIGFCGRDDLACFGAIAADECIRICRPIPEECDILMQDCADPLDTCTLARHPETDAPYTGCRPAGTQGPGDPCGDGMGSCDHGLICIREGMTTSCRQVCGGADMAPPACTEPGETCTGFARTWMVSYCRPPT
jgi:hypothetical protein